MVRGLEKFQEYFSEFVENYVIIGGSACFILISEAGLKSRATKDIDIILVVEALNTDFVTRFWGFVESGGYEILEKGEKDRKYYRFKKPSNDEYPFQIEIFSRKPDLLDLTEGSHLTPVPVSEETTSLSAILLDGEYYDFTINHSTNYNGLQIANPEALICLKVKAFLDLTKRKSEGEEISDKEIRKHKNDVLRLSALISEEEKHFLPAGIKQDMQNFVGTLKGDLPDNSILIEMGLGDIDVADLLVQLSNVFDLSN